MASWLISDWMDKGKNNCFFLVGWLSDWLPGLPAG
jgi:hypothetical protein